MMRVLIVFLICTNVNAMQSDIEEFQQAIEDCMKSTNAFMYKDISCELVKAQFKICQRRGACPLAFAKVVRAAAVNQDLQRAIVANSKKQERPRHFYQY